MTFSARAIPEYQFLSPSDDDDRVRTLEKIQPLVVKKAARFARSLRDRERAQFDIDDACQEVWLKLVKEMHLHDPSRTKFITWASYVIDRELIRLYGRARIVGPTRGTPNKITANMNEIEAERIKAMISPPCSFDFAGPGTAAIDVPDHRDHHEDLVDAADETKTNLDFVARKLSSPKLFRVIAWSYGISGLPKLPDGDIASRLKINTKKVRKLRSMARNEIRSLLASRA